MIILVVSFLLLHVLLRNAQRFYPGQWEDWGSSWGWLQGTFPDPRRALQDRVVLCAALEAAVCAWCGHPWYHPRTIRTANSPRGQGTHRRRQVKERRTGSRVPGDARIGAAPAGAPSTFAPPLRHGLPSLLKPACLGPSETFSQSFLTAL